MKKMFALALVLMLAVVCLSACSSKETTTTKATEAPVVATDAPVTATEAPVENVETPAEPTGESAADQATEPAAETTAATQG